MTAPELLELIREQVLNGAPIGQILLTPQDELMEQVISCADGTDALGWLTGQCECLEKLVGGLSGNSETWYDGLSDEEKQLAERIFELGQWAKKLYYHNAFDLKLVMPDYEKQCDGDATEETADSQYADGDATEETDNFRYANTALRQWVQKTPLRRLAAQTTYIVLSEETTLATLWNQAIQDYYAENCWNRSVNWSDVTECDNFTKQAWESMQTVDEHCRKGREKGLNLEQQRVVDALWSWVPHDFDDDVVATAREICQQAQALLPPTEAPRTEEGLRVYINKVKTEIVRIAESNDVYVDSEDPYGLTMGYLRYWLDEKYWGERRPQDD